MQLVGIVNGLNYLIYFIILIPEILDLHYKLYPDKRLTLILLWMQILSLIASAAPNAQQLPHSP